MTRDSNALFARALRRASNASQPSMSRKASSLTGLLCKDNSTSASAPRSTALGTPSMSIAFPSSTSDCNRGNDANVSDTRRILFDDASTYSIARGGAARGNNSSNALFATEKCRSFGARVKNPSGIRFNLFLASDSDSSAANDGGGDATSASSHEGNDSKALPETSKNVNADNVSNALHGSAPNALSLNTNLVMFTSVPNALHERDSSAFDATSNTRARSPNA
mmetsp:Transcript_6588/g.21644  ORF Transcript_6588/g.21644 Transcript_6588/m.21644 type:complete len:223 (-) Transcript_6588:754-1422(-)